MRKLRRTWSPASVTLCVALCFASGGALAKGKKAGADDVVSGIATGAFVVEIDPQFKGNAECETVRETLTTHLNAKNRFPPTASGKRIHQIYLECRPDAFEATWHLRQSSLEKAAKAKPKSSGPHGRDVPTVMAKSIVFRTMVPRIGITNTALVLMQDLMKKLPWDGEVTTYDSAKSDWSKMMGERSTATPPTALSQLDGIKQRKHMKIAAGTVNSNEVGICLPVEIGTIEYENDQRTFSVVGKGIVVAVDVFDSYAEAWADDSWKETKGKPLFFRHYDPQKEDKRLRKAKKQCDKVNGYAASKTLTNLLSGNFGALFAQETIEINAINQGVGASYYTLKATNGEKLPGGLAAYIYNTVLIGDLFMINFNIMRHVTAGKYDPTVRGKTTAGTLNLGEFYPNLIFDTETYAVFFGIGAYFSKINIPFLTPDLETDAVETGTTVGTDQTTTVTKVSKKIPIRKAILNPAMDLGASLNDGSVRYSGRIGFSFGKNGSHQSFYGNIDYMITNTWYAGFNLYALRFGEATTGDPGATFLSFGARIGFDLVRQADGGLSNAARR